MSGRQGVNSARITSDPGICLKPRIVRDLVLTNSRLLPACFRVSYWHILSRRLQLAKIIGGNCMPLNARVELRLVITQKMFLKETFLTLYVVGSPDAIIVNFWSRGQTQPFMRQFFGTVNLFLIGFWWKLHDYQKKINAKRLDTLTMERRKKVCFKGYDDENIVHLFPKYDIWRQSNSN